jgi:pimeloyl-ACP methyl ester carboxylesterase
VRLALAHPELVARLVLVVTGGYRDQDWARIQRKVTVETLADVDHLYQALFSHPPWMLRLTRRFFLKTYSSRSVSSVIATIREEHGFGDRELGSIGVPTAVIWGEQDGLFAAPVGERIARALPHSRFYLIGDCGHAVHWDRPRELPKPSPTFAPAVIDIDPRQEADHARAGIPHLPELRDAVLRLRVEGRRADRGAVRGLRQRGPRTVLDRRGVRRVVRPGGKRTLRQPA